MLGDVAVGRMTRSSRRMAEAARAAPGRATRRRQAGPVRQDRRLLPPRGHRGDAQNGPGLGRKRWYVEPSVAWLRTSNALRIHHERRVDMHDGPISVACSAICLRQLGMGTVGITILRTGRGQSWQEPCRRFDSVNHNRVVRWLVRESGFIPKDREIRSRRPCRLGASAVCEKSTLTGQDDLEGRGRRLDAVAEPEFGQGAMDGPGPLLPHVCRGSRPGCSTT